MKCLKNILLFRLAIIFAINIYFKNFYVFIFTFFLLFLIKKEESIILLCLLLLTLIKIDMPFFGYINKANDHKATINAIYKDIEIDNIGYEKGDFILGNRIFKNTPYKLSLNNLKAFDDEVVNLFKKILFNEYVNDKELIYNIGYGFGLYFLLKLLFEHNKYLSMLCLFIYVLFFDFKFKLLFIIIDFCLSFMDIESINNLAIKIIIVVLINIQLLFDYSILLTLIFSFIYKSKQYNSHFIIGLIQSFFFGQINIFVSLFYALYLKIRILIFIISLLCFICHPLLPIYLFIMKIFGFILNIFLLSIRGKVSFLSLFLIIIFYFLGLKKDYQLYFLLLFLLFTINNPFKHVTFVDVGQGDAILISNYNYKILLDTGSSYNYHKLKKNLYEQGVYVIDYLLISHRDEDHAGNIDNLKEDFYIKNIITEKKDVFYKDLYFKNLNVGTFEDKNDNSNIYYLDINNYAFLFTGDISQNIEKLVVNKYDLNKINCLKVAHHGSYTGTAPYFIGKILPDFAIISTNGKYNHPHVDTIKTLNKYLVSILSTKEKGNITFNFIGKLKFIVCENEIIFI